MAISAAQTAGFVNPFVDKSAFQHTRFSYPVRDAFAKQSVNPRTRQPETLQFGGLSVKTTNTEWAKLVAIIAVLAGYYSAGYYAVHKTWEKIDDVVTAVASNTIDNPTSGSNNAAVAISSAYNTYKYDNDDKNKQALINSVFDYLHQIALESNQQQLAEDVQKILPELSPQDRDKIKNLVEIIEDDKKGKPGDADSWDKFDRVYQRTFDDVLKARGIDPETTDIMRRVYQQIEKDKSIDPGTGGFLKILILWLFLPSAGATIGYYALREQEGKGKFIISKAAGKTADKMQGAKDKAKGIVAKGGSALPAIAMLTTVGPLFAFKLLDPDEWNIRFSFHSLNEPTNPTSIGTTTTMPTPETSNRSLYDEIERVQTITLSDDVYFEHLKSGIRRQMFPSSRAMRAHPRLVRQYDQTTPDNFAATAKSIFERLYPSR